MDDLGHLWRKLSRNCLTYLSIQNLRAQKAPFPISLYVKFQRTREKYLLQPVDPAYFGPQHPFPICHRWWEGSFNLSSLPKAASQLSSASRWQWSKGEGDLFVATRSMEAMHYIEEFEAERPRYILNSGGLKMIAMISFPPSALGYNSNLFHNYSGIYADARFRETAQPTH